MSRGRPRATAASVTAVVPALPRDASMETIVRDAVDVRRDIVSDGYDAALAALAHAAADARIHEYPTGARVLQLDRPEALDLSRRPGWKRWTAAGCSPHADHPLHVVSCSLPFDGVVTRDELMRHLHVHERLPDAIPFISGKYYERDWGLCCSRRLRDSLRDEQYVASPSARRSDATAR